MLGSYESVLYLLYKMDHSYTRRERSYTLADRISCLVLFSTQSIKFRRIGRFFAYPSWLKRQQVKFEPVHNNHFLDSIAFYEIDVVVHTES